MKVRVLREGTVVLQEVYLADTFRLRAKGLAGATETSQLEGLVLRPCWAIHSFGMRYAIDVVFLTRRGLVIKTVKRLPPARWAVAVGAWQVLEMRADRLTETGIQVSDSIRIEAHADDG